MLTSDPERTAGLTRHTQNRFIHDRIVFRLTIAWRYNQQGGLRMAKVNGLHVAILNDAVMLKLKRLNLRLRSKNIPTGQTTAFDHQQQLITGGVMTNATSGYLLDAAQNISRAVVVCWEGQQQQWIVDLLNNAGTAAQLVELPAAPAPAVREPRTKVVGATEADATQQSPA